MKKTFTLICNIIFYCTVAIQLQAQVNCNDNVFVSLSPWGGETNITPDMLIEGPNIYDDVTLDVNTVNCDDIGTPVVVTVTAILDGVTSTCTSTLTVEDKAPPVPVVIVGAEIFLDEFGIAMIDHTFIDNGSWDNCSENLIYEVSPNTFSCDNLDDEETIVTMTVTDEYGNWNSIWTNVVVKQDNGPIACFDTFEADLSNGPVLVGVDDILHSIGTNWACENNFTLTITDVLGNVVPANVITDAYSGQYLLATVVNSVGNDCTGLIEVTGTIPCDTFFICDELCRSEPIGDCDSGHTDTDHVEWPCNVTIYAFNVEADSLTPENLINQFGVNPLDASPQIVNYSCPSTLLINFNDQVIPINPNSYKIVRSWTILDWLTSQTYSYTQLISNLPNTTFICDTESRLSPVTNCEEGHSLEDDVEWPEDLDNITDYRITPIELISYSGVDILDSAPSFYNEPSLYTAEYVDYVFELEPELLTIGREWKVTRSDAPGSIWVYTQIVKIDLSAFNNLVTVETIGNRPIPDVQITADIYTDAEGNATVDNNDPLNPWLEDDPQNGLNILDIVLMRNHILGASVLSELQIQAAEISGEGTISTLDQVLLQRVILGIDVETSANWKFIEKVDSGMLASPKAQYYGIKPGDIDDSADLDFNNLALATTLEYTDIIINAGEFYQVPVTVQDLIETNGVEVNLNLNSANVELISASSTYFNGDIQWNTRANGLTTIILTNGLEEQLESIDANSVLFTLDIEAKANTVLSWSLDFAESRSSVTVNQDLNLEAFEGIVNGEIISGIDDFEILKGVNVYPNPANDFINISLEDSSEDYNMTIYTSNGQVVYDKQNAEIIDVSLFTEGLYFYTILQNKRATKGKFLIVK